MRAACSSAIDAPSLCPNSQGRSTPSAASCWVSTLANEWLPMPILPWKRTMALDPATHWSMRAIAEARSAGCAAIELEVAEDGDRVAGAFGYEREKGRFLVFAAKAVVIATGGLAELFGGGSERIEEVDPLLTLTGLLLIHERNRGG